MAFTLGATPAEATENGAGQATIASTGFTAGRQLIAMIGWSHASVTLTNVKYDSGGADERTFSQVGTVFDTGFNDGKMQILYLSNIPATKSTAVVCNWSGGMSGAGRLFVQELIGGNTTDCLDSSGSGTGSSTTLSCSFDTNTANCCIFASGATQGGEPVEDGGYSFIAATNIVYYDGCEYNLDVGAVGTKTPAMTSASAPWAFKAAAFKLAGGVSYDAATFPGVLMQTQGGAMIGRACRGVYG